MTEHPRGPRRGRLRVYLGAAPGVGKTYAMLAEANRRAARGTDVVVGIVETHGRPLTAEALGDLEVVPRREIEYRGSHYTELDVDAVLLRRPKAVLVDELAHTCVPGSTHAKRYEDVQDLLAAGIDVITTVNVQHLESLNDVVESITGIRQAETVPDAMVRGADAIELVDMSPQALRRRMAHGNIYAAEKVDAALSRYFREGNLAALRELALLWLADRVDEGLERYRDDHGINSTWATRERVVVALTGGPESATLARRAARIASRTAGGEWMAVYVTRRDGLVAVSPDQLAAQHAMIKDLGGTFHTVVSDDVAGGILDFARAENASQILVGASRRGRISTVLRPGIGEAVITRSGDIDVHIVTHDFARTGARSARRHGDLSRRRTAYGYAVAVVAPLLVSSLLRLTPDLHGLPTEAMVLMAVVVVSALVGGLVPAVVAAVLSGVLLNLLFVEPQGSLTISDPQNAVAIVIFTVVGVAVASVVALAARRTAEAVQARREADALAVLSHSLLHAGQDVGSLLAQAAEVFGMRGAAHVRLVDGAWVVEATQGDAPSGVPDSDVDVPVDDDSFLVLRGRHLDASERSLLTAYAAHVRVATERRDALREGARVAELDEGNRTRTALLAAVSHDLRSPLSAVKAAVSSLRNTEITWSAADEAAFLATIEESADRLDALVANLLDMSRLQTGAITPLATDVPVADVVSWAVSPLVGSERVTLCDDTPGHDAVVHADPGLLDRVVANVCDNALGHTPDGSPVEVRVSEWVVDGARRVSIRVVDHGPGVPVDATDALFAPFQRLGDVPRGNGLGLGLAVSRGLTEAMGGRLDADHTPGGGLTLVIDLPAGVGASDDADAPADRPAAEVP